LLHILLQWFEVGTHITLYVPDSRVNLNIQPVIIYIVIAGITIGGSLQMQMVFNDKPQVFVSCLAKEMDVR